MYTARLGSTVAATLVGDGAVTVVTVGYSDDFDETGGQLVHVETGDVYGYASADPDAETLTLTAGLPVGKTFAEGDALNVYPTAEDMFALVRLDDATEDEPITARVPHHLRPLLREGVRDPGGGEAVTLEAGADGWLLTDISGETPVIGGVIYESTDDSGQRISIDPDTGTIRLYSGQPGELAPAELHMQDVGPSQVWVELLSPQFTVGARSMIQLFDDAVVIETESPTDGGKELIFEPWGNLDIGGPLGAGTGLVNARPDEAQSSLTGIGATGWTLTGSGHCFVQVVDGVCFLDLSIERTGAAISPGASGNINPNVDLINALPPQYRPLNGQIVVGVVGDFSMCTANITTAGVITLETMHAGQNIGTGNRVHLNAVYPLI